MRIVNKILVIILLLALLPIVFVFMLQPISTLNVASAALDSFATSLETIATPGRAGIAIGIDVVLLGVVALQFRRGSQKARVGRVRGGEGEVSIETIEQRIQQAVMQVPGVSEVMPQVTAQRRQVVVSLEVTTAPDVNIPDMIDEVVKVVRKTVIDGMGLKLKGKPSVSIRHSQ